MNRCPAVPPSRVSPAGYAKPLCRQGHANPAGRVLDSSQPDDAGNARTGLHTVSTAARTGMEKPRIGSPVRGFSSGLFEEQDEVPALLTHDGTSPRPAISSTPQRTRMSCKTLM